MRIACSTNVSTEITSDRSSSRADTPLTSIDVCCLSQPPDQPLLWEQIPTGIGHTVEVVQKLIPFTGERVSYTHVLYSASTLGPIAEKLPRDLTGLKVKDHRTLGTLMFEWESGGSREVHFWQTSFQ